MKYKGIYAERPALFQLFILLLLLSMGSLFSSVIGMALLFICLGRDAVLSQHPDMMRLLQLISALGTFLFPALGLAWLCSKQMKKYLYIEKVPNLPTLAYTLFSMLLLIPAINVIGLLNRTIKFPEWMAPIENWMRAQEALAEQLTESLLSGDGVFTLAANLIVVAITAGVTEEFLFRGALQRLLRKWSSNHHVVIWSAAFLFSAFHLQFFGFIPRWLLGAYFGYLLYWGRSIWIPVFAHFTNNAIAVIGMSSSQLKDNEYINGNISDHELWGYSTFALASLLVFCLTIIQFKKHLTTKSNNTAF